MRRFSVTAAALFLAFIAGGCTGTEAASAHSCGAADKRFIETAGLNMTALGIWASGYQSGAIDPTDVAKEAHDAARRVGFVEPRDPSLRQAQKLIDAMFHEYGDAVSRYAKGKTDAGERMYRAYGLANFARDVLLEAQPALQKRGCNVEPLL